MIPLSPTAKALLRGFWPITDRAPYPSYAALQELIDAGYIIEEPAVGIEARYWCITIRGLAAKRKL